MSELADRLKRAEGDRGAALLEALSVMGEDLLRAEWRPEEEPLPDAKADRLRTLFDVLRAYQDEERVDRSRRRYLLLPTDSPAVPKGGEVVGTSPRGSLGIVSVDVVAAMGTDSDGRIRATSEEGTELVDGGLLDFQPIDGDESG